MNEEKFIVESPSKHMKAGKHGTYLQKKFNVFCNAEWTPNKDNSFKVILKNNNQTTL